MTRPVPFRTWFGLAIMLISEAGMLAKIEPFYHWHTPIAWTGWIFFADGLVWRRRGSSWLNDARAEFLFLAFMSVPLWVVFEMYNKYSIQNWYYLGLPAFLPLRYFGYAWSFATISPAIFETAELVSAYRDRRADETRRTERPGIPLGTYGWISVLAGAAMLIYPIVFPSPYLAAPIWLGFIFLLDPLNAAAGDESLRGDWREGRRSRTVNLMIAGLICGLLWEFWNYWGGAKWHYAVPILPNIRLFEMPVLGYGGFPPFALECFTMYVFVRRVLWRGATRPVAL